MKWDNQLINHLQWSNAIINREGKEIVAQEIAAMAKDGDVIGAGSGSTVYLTLFALAERIRKESLHIEVIPASAEISMTCIQLGRADFWVDLQFQFDERLFLVDFQD